MAYKARSESSELKKLKLLNVRMTLSDKEKQHLMNLIKGFEGEQRFDLLTEKLESECLILNDLMLQYNSTTIQADSVLIFSEIVNLYEVKNFEGDFLYESEKFFTISKKMEIVNPIYQLNRTETHFRQLLQILGFNMKVNAYVIFINPELMLYQAPLNKSFIFPNQIKRHFNSLNTIPLKLTKKNQLLAEKLASLHIEESPYTQLPNFNYEMLRKGIICKNCNSFLNGVQGKNCTCKNCGQKELVTEAVLRSVKEIKLLFPEMRITTNLVHDWCRIIETKRRVARTLEKHFEKRGTHQWTYYE